MEQKNDINNLQNGIIKIIFLFNNLCKSQKLKVLNSILPIFIMLENLKKVPSKYFSFQNNFMKIKIKKF